VAISFKMSTIRNSLFIFALLFAFAVSGSPVPQGIPYQAVARDAQGQPLSSRTIKVRFSILDSTATGAAVYIESHLATTNSLGLFSLNVGMGTSTTGIFSAINWGLNYKFLKVELDTTSSGNSYVDLGTQQMMSVPYALYAGSINTNSGGYNSTASHPITMVSTPSPIVAGNPYGISGYTFFMALEYCRSLTENGFSDWRLPTHDELIDFIQLNGFQAIAGSVWTTTYDYGGHIIFYRYTSPNQEPFSYFFVFSDQFQSERINCFR
jgi:hypothetical protein